jgi:hypothetical protein
MPDTSRPATENGFSAWQMFVLGLGVRLIGVALIWLGDGSSNSFRQAVVVVGVILSVGGIAVLKWLLYTGLRRNRPSDGAKPRADISPGPQ